MPIIQYGQVDSGFDTDITRITENDDTRITESNDIRITGLLARNISESYLNAIPTLNVLVSTMYYNLEGTWKIIVPYVKHSGAWKQPEIIYIKQSGIWRRVY